MPNASRIGDGQSRIIGRSNEVDMMRAAHNRIIDGDNELRQSQLMYNSRMHQNQSLFGGNQTVDDIEK